MNTDQLQPSSRLNAQFQAYFGTETNLAHPVVGNRDVDQIFESIQNFREERYTSARRLDRFARQAYYFLRPLLTRQIRQFIHRRIFESRVSRNFPNWPVDCSVDQLFRALMAFIVEVSGEEEIPFIWFWPNGQPAALMMTHDVEDRVGAAQCGALMDLDDSFGIPAAFQLIPEGPYGPINDLVKAIRLRGHEVNLHDLDHDGRLYENAKEFAERSKKIRQYAETYGTKGFRAGSMHRNHDWLPSLQVEFDMSVPNVAHMEPRGGGCCTVMPYFIGNVLELPLTTVQDYGLFNILKETSIDLWKKQLETILAQNGLISFIVHPDYIVETQEKRIYTQLLDYLAQQKDAHNLWAAQPTEINAWWRQRQNMRLAPSKSGWMITGEGSERAKVAYASVIDGEVRYRLATNSVERSECQQFVV